MLCDLDFQLPMFDMNIYNQPCNYPEIYIFATVPQSSNFSGKNELKDLHHPTDSVILVTGPMKNPTTISERNATYRLHRAV